MEQAERDNLINTIGKQLADLLPNFFGKIRYNIQDGNYVNANVEETILPKKDNEIKAVNKM